MLLRHVREMRVCTIFSVALLVWSSLASAQDFTGKVIGVADGHSITVMHQGRGESIRLLPRVGLRQRCLGEPIRETLMG